MQMSDEELLTFLGIPWKEIPSVKLVPPKLWQTWKSLPRLIAILRD